MQKNIGVCIAKLKIIQVDLILSRGTQNCIFLLFTCVPENSDDQDGITWAFSGWMPKPRLCKASTSS